jgi:glycosyltransferase involved in cell wall biosynthesis
VYVERHHVGRAPRSWRATGGPLPSVSFPAVKILGLYPDEDGCAHYRMHLPFWCLDQAPDISARATRYHRKGDEIGADVDLVVGQRFHAQVSSAYFHALSQRMPTVFEIDDLLWNLDPTSPAFALFNNRTTMRQILRNLMSAHLITTTTEELAAEIKSFTSGHREATIIPNMVPMRLLRRGRRDLDHDGPIRIGYPGTWTHEGDVGQMEDGLRKLLKKCGRHVELHFVGADFRKQLRVEGSHDGFRNVVDAFYDLIDFDVILAPLRTTPFNDAKSDIKILEAAALGIPCIASNTGPYRRSVIPGVTGLLASTPAEWFEALRTMVFDRDARVEMGEHARAWATTRTYEGNVHLWRDAYASIV